MVRMILFAPRRKKREEEREKKKRWLMLVYLTSDGVRIAKKGRLRCRGGPCAQNPASDRRRCTRPALPESSQRSAFSIFSVQRPAIQFRASILQYPGFGEKRRAQDAGRKTQDTGSQRPCWTKEGRYYLRVTGLQPTKGAEDEREGTARKKRGSVTATRLRVDELAALRSCEPASLRVCESVRPLRDAPRRSCCCCEGQNAGLRARDQRKTNDDDADAFLLDPVCHVDAIFVSHIGLLPFGLSPAR